MKLVPGQKIVVYGGDDRIPALNARVGHGDQFKVKCQAFQQNKDTKLLYRSLEYGFRQFGMLTKKFHCASLTMQRIYVFLQFCYRSPTKFLAKLLIEAITIYSLLF